MKAGLVGPSYQQSSLPWDAQRTIGLWPLIDQGGKEPSSLYSVPGNSQFAACPFGVGRGTYKASNGRAFATVGTNLCEVNASGVVVVRGSLPESVGYVLYADNGFQLAVCDGRNLFMLNFEDNDWRQIKGGLEYCVNGDFATADGWTFGVGWAFSTDHAEATAASSSLSRPSAYTLEAGKEYRITYTITRSAGSVQPKIGGTLGISRSAAGTYNEIITSDATDQLIEFVGTGFTGTVDDITVVDSANGFVSAASVTFLDGYFIVSRGPDSGIFQISDLYNGYTWEALDFATAESSPDNLLRVINVAGQLWLVGVESAEIWASTGSLGFPFQRVSGAKIEYGTVSVYGMISMDNSLFWVGQNKEGFGIVFRANGFSPERVSTETIEKQIQSAPSPETLKFCAYQEEGHTFLMITGGGMETALVYDLATKLWHERAFLNEFGRPEQPRINDLMFVFGRQIGCSRQNTGLLYHQSLDYVDDDGDEILRERTFTHIFDEKKRMQFPSLVIDFEAGVGNQTGEGVDPQCILHMSDDGGKTWFGGQQKSIGKAGKFLTRVAFFRLGQARQRTYKVRITEKVKVRITGAYFNNGRQ